MMKTPCAIALTLVLLASAAHATCKKTTLFFCKTTNGKQIEVCDSGSTIDYSFGKPNKPELSIKVPRTQVTTSQWKGIGRYMSYSVDIPSGDVIYNVYSSIDKHTAELDGGVSVTTTGAKYLATVKCSVKSMVSNLEGVDLKEAE